MVWYISVSMAVVGTIIGSFIGAQIWRLRARQLVEDAAAGESVDMAELKRLRPLLKSTVRQDRSRCLSCRHELAWYDLLPVVGWLMVGGRCRYCRAPIGYMELALEVGTGLLFGVATWRALTMYSEQFLFAKVALLLAAMACLVFLFAYDRRWFILPDVVNIPFIFLAAVLAALHLATGDAPGGFASLAGAVLILSGLYLVLYVISKGQWIGFGDVKLNLGLALLLMDWRLAFLALFLANFLGTLLVLPGMLRGTLSRTTRVPFGPLLILGFLLAWLWGESVVAWFAIV